MEDRLVSRREKRELKEDRSDPGSDDVAGPFTPRRHPSQQAGRRKAAFPSSSPGSSKAPAASGSRRAGMEVGQVKNGADAKGHNRADPINLSLSSDGDDGFGSAENVTTAQSSLSDVCSATRRTGRFAVTEAKRRTRAENNAGPGQHSRTTATSSRSGKSAPHLSSSRTRATSKSQNLSRAPRASVEDALLRRKQMTFVSPLQQPSILNSSDRISPLRSSSRSNTSALTYHRPRTEKSRVDNISQPIITRRNADSKRRPSGTTDDPVDIVSSSSEASRTRVPRPPGFKSPETRKHAPSSSPRKAPAEGKPRGVFGAHGKGPTHQSRRSASVEIVEGKTPPLKRGRQAVPGGHEAIQAARNLSQAKDLSSTSIGTHVSQPGRQRVDQAVSTDPSAITAPCPSSPTTPLAVASITAGLSPDGIVRTSNSRNAPALSSIDPPRSPLEHPGSTNPLAVGTATAPPRHVPLTPSLHPAHSTPPKAKQHLKQTFLSPRGSKPLVITAPKRKRSAEDADPDFTYRPKRNASNQSVGAAAVTASGQPSGSSTRPTRARLAPGTYAIPDINAPDDAWRAKSSYSGSGGRTTLGRERTVLTTRREMEAAANRKEKGEGGIKSKSRQIGPSGQPEDVAVVARSDSAGNKADEVPASLERRGSASSALTPLSSLSLSQDKGPSQLDTVTEEDNVDTTEGQAEENFEPGAAMGDALHGADEFRLEDPEVEEPEQLEQPEQLDILTQYADFDFLANTPTKPTHDTAHTPASRRFKSPPTLVSTSRPKLGITPSRGRIEFGVSPTHSKLALSPTTSLSAIRASSPLAAKNSWASGVTCTPSLQASQATPLSPTATPQNVSDRDGGGATADAAVAGVKEAKEEETETDTDNFIADILARDERMRREQEEQIKRVSEARRAKWAIVEEKDEEEDEEEGIEEVDLQMLAEGKPIRKTSEPTRRSARILFQSIEPDRAQLPSKPVQPPVQRKIGKDDEAFEKLIMQHRRDARNGTTAEDGVRMLANVKGEYVGEGTRLGQSRKGVREVPWPTPDSGLDSPDHTDFPGAGQESEDEEEEDEEMELGIIDLDNLRQRMPEDFEGMGAFDPTLLRDARREVAEREKSKSGRGSVMPDWEGFWGGPAAQLGKEQVKFEAEGKKDVARIVYRKKPEGLLKVLVDTAERGQVAPLAICLTAGLLDATLSGQAGALVDFLIDTVVSAASQDSVAIATEALIYVVKSATSDPFGEARLLARAKAIWRSLGARESVLGPPLPLGDLVGEIKEVALDCQTASGVICGLITATASKGWISGVDAEILATLLVFLAADPTTSLVLRHTIDETLLCLWPLWLAETTAVGVAMTLVERARLLPTEVQAQLLLAVGKRSGEARNVSRWMGIGLLVSGCLKALAIDEDHVVPAVELLLEGTKRLYQLVVVSRTKPTEAITSKVRDWITFLYEAVCVEGLVETSEVPKEGEEHPLVILRSAVNRVTHKMVMGVHADSRQIRNKSRLDQLRTMIQIQLGTAMGRKKTREQVGKVLGRNLERGEGKQARLSFGQGRIGVGEPYGANAG